MENNIQTPDQNLEPIKTKLNLILIIQVTILIILLLPIVLIIVFILVFNQYRIQKGSPEILNSIRTNLSPTLTNQKLVCGLSKYELFENNSRINSETQTEFQVTPTSSAEYISAIYQCKGENKEREIVINAPINKASWIKKLNNYCKIPCDGFEYTDNCAQYKSATKCHNAKIEENCAWYSCQNVCLSVGTPIDLVCNY